MEVGAGAMAVVAVVAVVESENAQIVGLVGLVVPVSAAAAAAAAAAADVTAQQYPSDAAESVAALLAYAVVFAFVFAEDYAMGYARFYAAAEAEDGSSGLEAAAGPELDAVIVAVDANASLSVSAPGSRDKMTMIAHF